MTQNFEVPVNHSHQRSPLRALVVEDEADVAQYLMDTLEDFGYDVTFATSAESALAVVEKNMDFSIAFIDLGLPGRSGLELKAELLRLYPNLQVVFATGYAERARLDMQDRDDHTPVLAKPFQLSSIKQILNGLR